MPDPDAPRTGVMQVLDIDLDFFASPALTWPASGMRPSEADQAVWSPEDVRDFLEKQCGLSRENRIRGWVFRHHDEAFYYWKDLIDSQDLSSPFDLVHVDAHSDLGSEGYGGYRYVMTDLLARPLHDRAKPDGRRIGPSNFPVFAIANRWITSFTFVMQDDYTNDMLNCYWADPDDAHKGLQLKRYREEDIERVMRIGSLVTPLQVEPVVPLHLISSNKYYANRQFNVATICQSPHYCPASADFILDIFRDYIHD